MTTKQSIFNILISLLIAFLIILAGGSGGISASGVRLFALCGLLAFAIQWICFIPSWFLHTERFFDLVGSATHLTITLVALLAISDIDTRSVVLGIMIGLWALRLGTFLFARVQTNGHDARFDLMKHHFAWFLMTWTVQGLWVLLASSAAIAAITAKDRSDFGWIGIIGLIIWVIGFVLEVVSDEQKRKFKLDPSKQSLFINKGLWAWSQHPNYFGEIVLWIGVSLVALPGLSSWQYFTLISPIFVFILLTRISGIPMLNSASKKRWSDDPEFQAYKESTPVLFPRPPRSL
jgi:steroid 5-alpha reductase family enzyme